MYKDIRGTSKPPIKCQTVKQTSIKVINIPTSKIYSELCLHRLAIM